MKGVELQRAALRGLTPPCACLLTRERAKTRGEDMACFDSARFLPLFRNDFRP
jgi:hypothetical protein